MGYRVDMNNGIKLFRERAGISKAELARLIGTTRPQVGRLEDGGDPPKGRRLTPEWAAKIARVLKCTPQELLFPELARIDLGPFNHVFEIQSGVKTTSKLPGLSLETEFLARMLPNASAHNLRFMIVDSDQGGIVAKGDALVIDLNDNVPNRPALYALDIGGVVQWRYLTPTTAGTVQVSDHPAATIETVNPKDLNVIGRARLKISTL